MIEKQEVSSMQGVYVKKPTLPKGVVEDMKNNKGHGLELSEVFWELERGDITDKNKNINEWIYGDDSLVEDLSGKIEDFSLAWITGEYEIEKESAYILKVDEVYASKGDFYGAPYYFFASTNNKKSVHIFKSREDAEKVQLSIGGEIEEI